MRAVASLFASAAAAPALLAARRFGGVRATVTRTRSVITRAALSATSTGRRTCDGSDGSAAAAADAAAGAGAVELESLLLREDELKRAVKVWSAVQQQQPECVVSVQTTT